jgi:hypothetical protein
MFNLIKSLLIIFEIVYNSYTFLKSIKESVKFFFSNVNVSNYILLITS